LYELYWYPHFHRFNPLVGVDIQENFGPGVQRGNRAFLTSPGMDGVNRGLALSSIATNVNVTSVTLWRVSWVCVKADFVSDKHRPVEHHAIHGYRDAPPARATGRGVSTSQIHLRH